MGEVHTPDRAEVFAAMMDSLIGSFQMADDTASRPLFSFNYGDIAEMLDFYRAIYRATPAREAAEDLVEALWHLCAAYAACNGEDHPAYVSAQAALARVKGGAA